MRFGTKLLAAIERGEWVRRRSWHKDFKMRKRDEGFFVDERGFIASLGPADIFATDWVIVRRKKPKAPTAPVADDPRYEPIETMPVVGDRVAHPNDDGGCPPLAVERILEAWAIHRWRVEAGGSACSLNSNGYGWRILKRRNVFTDPKPGDVIGSANATMEVRFVDAEAVLFRWNDGSPCAVRRETWASYATVGWTVQKLGRRCAITELEQFIADAEKHQQFDDIPTLCAMLTAAMKELQGIVEYWNGAPESAVDAIETVADRAHNCLAHLNTLAAEALGTKGASDE